MSILKSSVLKLIFGFTILLKVVISTDTGRKYHYKFIFHYIIKSQCANIGLKANR